VSTSSTLKDLGKSLYWLPVIARYREPWRMYCHLCSPLRYGVCSVFANYTELVAIADASPRYFYQSDHQAVLEPVFDRQSIPVPIVNPSRKLPSVSLSLPFAIPDSPLQYVDRHSANNKEILYWSSTGSHVRSCVCGSISRTE
jgi:hypothetical protein